MATLKLNTMKGEPKVMFDKYSDVIDLIRDIKESQFNFEGFDKVNVFTAWGICDLYPVLDAKAEEEMHIHYNDLIAFLPLFPENAREIPHEISIQRDDLIEYGDRDSLVAIFIRKFSDYTELTIFLQYSPRN